MILTDVVFLVYIAATVPSVIDFPWVFCLLFLFLFFFFFSYSKSVFCLFSWVSFFSPN